MRLLSLKSSVFITIAILFTGCAGEKVFTHPDSTPQRFAYDKAVCNNFARGAYGNIPYQNIPSYDNKYNVSGYANGSYYNGTITQQPTFQQNMNGIAQGIANIAHQNRLEEAFDACMFQKGWSLENSRNSFSNNDVIPPPVTKPINNYDSNGYNKDGYDKEGYDKFGYDRNNFNKSAVHKITNTKFDDEGYDIYGFNQKGYNKENELDFNRMSESQLIIEIKKDSDIYTKIRNPSYEIQKEAIKINPFLIYEIKNPSEELQLIAISKDKRSFKMIDNPTTKVREKVKEYTD
jgi:hypothetical protein